MNKKGTMNKRGTKSALITGAVSLLLCISMLIGTTFAWFTDSVSSGGNIIKAGNLEVAMEWLDGTEEPLDTSAWADASGDAIFDYDLWEPGYTVARHVKISNAGSLALKYQLSVVANGEVSSLADVIDVYYLDPARQVGERDALDADMRLGSLSEVLAGLDTTASGSLGAGESHVVTLVLKMRESAGNEYQNKSIGTDFRIVLAATQKDSESDTFGDDYDAGLDPEATYVSAISELIAAMNKGGKVVLSSDINITADNVEFRSAKYITAVMKDTVINLNGHDITVDLGEEYASISAPPTLFYVYSGASLTIEGEGNLSASNDACLIWAHSKSTGTYIYGGNYSNDNMSTGVKGNMAIVYSSGGRVDIYGGAFTFEGTTADASGFNVQDSNSFKNEIVLHEGVLLSSDAYYSGLDAGEIALAEGCYLKNVQIDGKEWWQVTKAEEEIIVDSFADMVDVCRTGGQMVLADDISYTAENTEMMIDGSIFLVNGKNVTLDLNGHNITIDEDATQVYGALFFVGNPGGHIDIVGDGEITVKNGLATIVWVLQSGTANIYDGTYTSNSVSNEAMFYSQGNGGVIHVYGGRYTYDLDRHLNGGFNVSDNAGGALRIIIHEGVLLSRPEYSQHLQGTTNGEESRIQLAEGCTLTEVELEGTVWYLVTSE